MKTARQTNAHPVARPGVTLTEVLIALLILSIGVLSVFSLYPISLLRSIKASQSTNATIAAANAVERLRTDEKLLNGSPFWRPNAFYVPGDVISVPPVRGGALSPTPLKYVAVGPATGGTSGSEPPPFGLETVTQDYLLADPPTGDAVPATMPPMLALGGVLWRRALDAADGNPYPSTASGYPADATYGGIADGRSLSSAVYAVDPRGWMSLHAVAGATPNGRAVRDSYGTAPRFEAGMRTLLAPAGLAWGGRNLSQWGNPATTINSAYAGRFYDTPPVVFPAGEPTAAQMRAVATANESRQDAYETFFEAWEPLAGAGTIPGPGEFLVDADGNFSAFGLPLGINVGDLSGLIASFTAQGVGDGVRLQVRSRATGRSVDVPLAAGNVDGANNALVGLPLIRATDLGAVTATADVLPIEVRVSTRGEQYSYLYTVRRPQADVPYAEGDVVVFFRRSVTAPAETGFAASFGNNPFVTDDDRYVFDGTNWNLNPAYDPVLAGTNARRAWVAGSRDVDADGVAEADAEVEIGRYVFDSVGGHWYRIDAVLGSTADATGGVPGAVIYALELDRAVEEVTPAALRIDTGGAVAPPNAVNQIGNGAATVVGLAYPQAVVPRGVVAVVPFNTGRDGDAADADFGGGSF